ncbi:MAG: hypothetical protein ABT01_01800 [Clostridium sp. SCN 57-10]|nr:MAG: hypothetical protein ABT01_01800 [Clostridium sp. SCN 57-10]
MCRRIVGCNIALNRNEKSGLPYGSPLSLVEKSPKGLIHFAFSATCAAKKHLNPPISLKKSVK